ncbi:MAG TPA: hypothetical protein VJC18_08955 [bacterium]|nr:hypothetical protein [bacterium]
MTFIFVVLFIPEAHALEADQYVIWTKSDKLKDATPQINALTNQVLQEFLDRYVNNEEALERNPSCESLSVRFLLYVRPHFFLDRIKGGLVDDPQIELSPQKTDLFKDYSSSIYKGFRWPFVMPVAQTIFINGVYLGTDKIDHFFSSGRRYFNVYRRARKQGLSHEEAIKKALDFGLSVFEEKGVLGYWTSGAFSYADIEANFQGMMLGINMCKAESPHLAYDALVRKWYINKPIEWQEYVSPLWDEAYNNSYYFSYRWNGVKKVLEEVYCKLGLDGFARSLWKSYDESVRVDEHIRYLQELLQRGKIPDPKKQSLHEVCRYPAGVMEGAPFWDTKMLPKEND